MDKHLRIADPIESRPIPISIHIDKPKTTAMTSHNMPISVNRVRVYRALLKDLKVPTSKPREISTSMELRTRLIELSLRQRCARTG